MIHEVDEALRRLVERELDEQRRGDLVRGAHARTGRHGGARRRSTSTSTTSARTRLRRNVAREPVHDEHGIVVGRRRPPRMFKLSYLVTAWTQRPEDEHRLLSTILACALRYDALPRDILSGSLSEQPLNMPVTVALPPPEDRAISDVWTALGGELKPSLDLVITAPVDSQAVLRGREAGARGAAHLGRRRAAERTAPPARGSRRARARAAARGGRRARGDRGATGSHVQGA